MNKLLIGSAILLMSWLGLHNKPYTSSVSQPMMFSDTSRLGRPFAKDPHVIAFQGRYLLYYSIPAGPGRKGDPQGWSIGIAESKNLTDWRKIGEITPAAGATYEKNGLCAPGALVRDGKVHLFYQTYGNRERDAICHGISSDGITFVRDASNPVFHPTGAWTCGRAIDAEVVRFRNRYLLYFATRDKGYTTQMQGVASSPINTSFGRSEWTQLADSSILKPTLPWEKQCVEGASCVQIGDSLYMFYAGGYNNEPQQIGVAVSKNGVQWKRLANRPLLANGKPGSWNVSESGHPHLFKDLQGNMHLFFQGNNDNGKTWFISQRNIRFSNGTWQLE